MKQSHIVTALAFALLSACAGAKVDVKTLATSPRPLAPVKVESLKKFETRPDGAVAVYDIDAYGDTKPALDAAVQAKAASLGCDGVMMVVHKEGANTAPDATTGQLNDHTTRAGSHVVALCIVMPKGDATTAGGPAPGAGEAR